MTGWLRWILACALAARLLVGAVSADAEAERERFSWHPSLALTFEANDNGLLAVETVDTDWSYGAWLEPRLELELERERWRAGADLGADLRYSVDESRLRDAFLDVRGWFELEIARGLLLRVSDSFVPHSVRLGSPTDDLSNLRQSNRALVELLYRRELTHGRAFELGFEAERFDAQGFEAVLDLDGDGLPNLVGDLHADYWGGGAHFETQQGIGRGTLVYLRGEMRERSFDEIPRSDFQEWSSLIGLRRKVARRLELDMAVGYGQVEYADLPASDRLLGRARLDYSMPHGWDLQGMFVQRFSAGAGGFDFNETSGRLELSKRLGARTRARASGLWSRFHADSPSSDPNVVTAFELGLERQISRRIQAVLDWRHWRNAGETDNDDFRQNRVTLGFTYRR